MRVDLSEGRPMMATVSDVASATSILLAVCLVVLLTLIAVCRLLRRGTFLHRLDPAARRCSDGMRCAADRGGNHAAPAAPGRGCPPPPAQVPGDPCSVAVASDQQHSSKIDLYLAALACILIARHR